MTHHHTARIGAALRRIRLQQGRTLRDVEEATHRRFKVNILSAYERGTRMISIERLSELAHFYGVPVSRLVVDIDHAGRGPLDPAAARRTEPVVLDLRALAIRGLDDLSPVRRFASRVQRDRGDRGRDVLTLRRSDILVLADAAGTTGDRLLGRLVEHGLLLAGGSGARPSV